MKTKPQKDQLKSHQSKSSSKRP